MGTSFAIKDRRRQVQELSLRGTKIEHIADSFHVSTRTIDNDIKAIRKELSKRMETDTGIKEVWGILGEYSEAQRMRIQKLWGIIANKTVKNKEILAAVKLLQDEEVLKIRRDQIAGVLPKDSPMVAIQNNIGDKKEDIPEILEDYMAQVENDLKQIESKQKKKVNGRNNSED